MLNSLFWIIKNEEILLKLGFWQFVKLTWMDSMPSYDVTFSSIISDKHKRNDRYFHLIESLTPSQRVRGGEPKVTEVKWRRKLQNYRNWKVRIFDVYRLVKKNILKLIEFFHFMLTAHERIQTVDTAKKRNCKNLN